MGKICFVIMGYGIKTDYESGKSFDLDKTYLNIIKPAVEAAGFETIIRGDEIQESGTIDKGMYALLIHADLVIADITTFNPNALYELGVRHASRPYSTIIMKDVDGNIPFDINHTKIFTYKHMGDDISATEAERSKKKLIDLINTIDGKKSTDSPLFELLNVQPSELHKEDFTSFIKELSEKENHLFAIVEQAKAEMKDGKFEEAIKLWTKALSINDDEHYYIQQKAICIYKGKQPSERTALQDALQVINELELENNKTNDPETLGITGAIYKRLWILDKDVEYLNRAIEYYGRGFNVNSDYYTGENYAICLDWKSMEVTDSDERTYYRIQAKKTREEIARIIDEIFEADDFESRGDIKWVYATRANCAFALDDDANYVKYKNLFESKVEAEWERDTFEEGIDHLRKLK